MAQPTEGQTAIGPNGERAVFRGGQWIVMGGPQAPQMPANPTYDLERPKVQTDIERTQVQTQGDAIANTVAGGTAPTTIARQNAPEGYMWIDPSQPELGVRKLPGYAEKSAAQTAADLKDEGQQRKAQVVRSMMGEVQKLYEANIQGQPASRLWGATERIQSLPGNEEFNTAAANILPLIRPMIASSAKEGDSDKEMEIFLSYIPNSRDSDRTIERKMKQLELLIGGLVDGRSPTQVQNSDEFANPQGSVWQQNFIAGGGNGGAAPFGATQQNIEMPPEMQNEHQAFISQWMGNPDPDAYAAFRSQLDRKIRLYARRECLS